MRAEDGSAEPATKTEAEPAEMAAADTAKAAAAAAAAAKVAEVAKADGETEAEETTPHAVSCAATLQGPTKVCVGRVV